MSKFIGSTLALNVGTIPSGQSIFTQTGTWNNSSSIFVADLINITDTASASTSLFIQYQIGGITKFAIDKTGAITTGTIPYGSVTSKSVVDADVSSGAAIAWTKISKTGSSLADLVTRSVTNLTEYTSTSGTGLTAIRSTITTPATNQVLTWNGTNWINQAVSAAAAYATVQEEGSALTQRTIINFIGAGITAVDNSGSTRTDVTILSASASQEGTISIGAQTFAGLKTFNGGIATALGTITVQTPNYSDTVTWNAGAIQFIAENLNVTDTASAANSLFVRYQVGGVTKYAVDKTGAITTGTIPYTSVTSKSIVDADVAVGAAIAWSKISKTGSALADLITRSVTDLTEYTTISGTGSTAILATVSTPATNQVLTWNGTNWVNQTPSSAGYATVQGQGSNVTARAILNFSDSVFAVVDNSGSARTDITLADASASVRGVITTGAQTLAGNKTLSVGGITLTPGTTYNTVNGTLFSDSSLLNFGHYAGGVKHYWGGTFFAQKAGSTVANIAQFNTSIVPATVGGFIGSATLQANYFAPGKSVEIVFGGVYTSSATAPPVTLRLLYNAVLVATATTATTWPASQTNSPFYGKLNLTCQSVTSGSGVFYCAGFLMNNANILSIANASGVTITLANNGPIDIQMACSAGSNPAFRFNLFEMKTTI
jgi:hypothetical protein